MKALNKRQINTGRNDFESKEAERRRLFSNNAGNRSASLGVKPAGEFASEHAALDYLASILVDIYLQLEHEKEAGD